MELFLCAVGLLFILEGAPYFLSPGKMKRWLIQLDEFPNNQLRLMGLISMLLGALIIYLARKIL